jgi:tetratricopeptide (TPR) repeat protein
MVARGNYAGAAHELQQCLATEPHASPAMHARYRELLAKIDDQAGLLAHARMQLSALLVAGNEREALALLRDSLARDPQFRPAAAEETTRLARVAERHGQHDLALTLLQDFQLRNPRDYDGPANALLAAKLLLERRSDVAGARAVLQAAIDRYLPAHPDHAELLQRLAEIDRLSRRLPGAPSIATPRDP